MKILILEDEIPAYQKLAAYLEHHFKDGFETNWGRSIAEGELLLKANTYDLILSDIQLLDGVSFDLFSTLEIDCPIIFCSAYDNYLFDAFNTNGIAYILKPYTKEDLTNALNKYEALCNKSESNPINNDTLEALKAVISNEHISYKERFVIKRTKGIQLLNVEDIGLIEASGDFCMATDVNGKTHPISSTFGAIYQQVSPLKFFKINRSQIVHIDAIEHIENHFKNRLLITIKGASDKVMTSSSTTSDFRKWLE